MFEIPAWEEQKRTKLLNSNVGFENKIKKKAKNLLNPVKEKDNPVTKNLIGSNNLPIYNRVTKKRKCDNKIINANNKNQIEKDTDELLINANFKKIKEIIDNDDKEIQELSKEKTGENKVNTMSKKMRIKKILIDKKNKTVINKTDTIDKAINNTDKVRSHLKKDMKKEKLKAMLKDQSYRNHITSGETSNKLRQRMLERLKAAQFRYLNEKLYTSSGTEAQQLFKSDPAAFQTYHRGYQQQLKKWPVNPLDVIVNKIMKMPKSYKVADLGCGEAALSRRIPHPVRSFDLVAVAPGVEPCDMAHTPLLSASMDVVVYCLALMGKELTKYLIEANRILKIGGHVLIAEVESRFANVDDFAKEVQRLGFKLKQLDKANKVFFFIEFVKIRDPPVKKSKLPALTLKPCLYKKR